MGHIDTTPRYKYVIRPCRIKSLETGHCEQLLVTIQHLVGKSTDRIHIKQFCRCTWCTQELHLWYTNSQSIPPGCIPTPSSCLFFLSIEISIYLPIYLSIYSTEGCQNISDCSSSRVFGLKLSGVMAYMVHTQTKHLLIQNLLTAVTPCDLLIS